MQILLDLQESILHARLLWYITQPNFYLLNEIPLSPAFLIISLN